MSWAHSATAPSTCMILFVCWYLVVHDEVNESVFALMMARVVTMLMIMTILIMRLTAVIITKNMTVMLHARRLYKCVRIAFG